MKQLVLFTVAKHIMIKTKKIGYKPKHY